MKLVYGVSDKPAWGKTLVFALQQLLAIMAATITVPLLVNQATGAAMSTSAALFGAGVGTLVYLLFTKFKSPVFLGSSFAFIPSLIAAFSGAASASVGYLGIIIGAILAGLVYVILALIVKKFGTNWINKLMPAVIIGPTVAIIGLSLSGAAIQQVFNYAPNNGNGFVMSTNTWMCVLVALVALAVTIACSVFGKKMVKMIPFIIGIGAGYVLALIITGIGYGASNDALKLIDFGAFTNAGWGKFVGGWLPDFTFIKAFGSFGDGANFVNFGAYFGTITLAFVPVAFVVFAEHIADHKNLSTIVEQDLLTEPGLHRTLLGDGVGSMAGAFFGGCPNTTYGESIGCVAISGNASVRTICVTAIMAIVLSFILPFTVLLASIPQCVMGGICIALYGFIAVSGLKMIQKVDLNDNKNLFVVSVILICGAGGFAINIVFNAGQLIFTDIACALILGILTNLLVNIKKGKVVATIGPKAKQDKEEK